jgi:hypothetical protein
MLDIPQARKKEGFIKKGKKEALNALWHSNTKQKTSRF